MSFIDSILGGLDMSKKHTNININLIDKVEVHQHYYGSEKTPSTETEPLPDQNIEMTPERPVESILENSYKNQ